MTVQKLKIKKGDQVIVLTGKDKGKKGEVLKVLPSLMKVLVSGVGIVKKHMKPSRANPNGGIIPMEKPVHYSNVSIIDPKVGTATKIGFKILEDGKKVRFARKSKEVIDN